ncbi:MAG: DNA repair ATPase, partial [Planctomycetaceae bacterium]
MATPDPDNQPADAAPEIALESGTYEIIRNRLSGYGKELAERMERLNVDRKAVFGAIETALLSTERITTQHNCVPRDMVAIGDRFLFGYNVHIGLKTETDLADVFAVYEFRENSFRELGLELLRDERFEKEFQDVYRYYKNATFAKFFTKGPHLYMVMRVGKSVADIKTFKWLVQGDSLVYVDSRSDHEVRYPPQHEFEWKRTTRDLHQSGLHPHISIEDRVFVETVGGDLTIKIENNTDSGEGIYSEPVDDPDQTLDDAEVYYAVVGNVILLKIRPYQEQKHRYFIYNDKIQRAIRLDSVERACVLLPDHHGLIFANGYYLQTGEHKTFDSVPAGLIFERRIAAPNGEDFLYVFYHRDRGEYVLLRYNLIAQQVETPIVCNGYTLFEAGELVCFRSQGEPQKHHAVQLWQTPYVGEDHNPPTQSDSYLYKIGNKDIVRAMAECHEVLALIDKEDTYANLYVDISKEASDVLDSYFWVNREETHRLDEPLAKIKEAAAAAVEEFDKVVRVKRNTAEQTKRVRDATEEILGAVTHRRYEHINDFVQSLADLRSERGEIISLRDLRYADETLIESLETRVVEQSDRLSHRCVEFLLNPNALQPYVEKIQQQQDGIPHLTKVADAKKVEEDVAASAGELEMLIEIVSNLKIDDATQRTAIIDNISTIFATVNQARAALKRQLRELSSVEGVAEFNSQLKLLNQSVVNYLDICDTPDKCEEFLTKVMIQLEELEGRFAEFDEFIVQLSEKRDEVYNAFESRKLALVESRNKRAGALAAAADRILKGIKNRVERFESVNDINSYFASDLMIGKVRDLCEQLDELDDSVKVDDIQSRLKTVREDAVRQLKDRQELYVDGQNVIQFGNHQFSVNVQALDLTTVLRDGAFNLHLTGTNFFEEIEDEFLNDSRDVWDQDVVSENRDVYRGEYLAYKVLTDASAPFGRDPKGNAATNGATDALPSGSRLSLDDLRQMDDDALAAFVARFMGPRYSEGYVKGVHDRDAAKLLRVLVEMQATIGLLRFHTRARALGAVFWEHFAEPQRKALMAAKLHGMGAISRVFPAGSGREAYVDQLRALLREFVEQFELFEPELVDEAAEYLFFELAGGELEEVGPKNRSFTVSRTAADLCDAFQSHLKQFGHAKKFAVSVKSVEGSPVARFRLARNWVRAFLGQHDTASRLSGNADYADEVAAMLLRNTIDSQSIVDARVEQTVEGLAGTHPSI